MGPGLYLRAGRALPFWPGCRKVAAGIAGRLAYWFRN
jgi:hypothetical protein